MLSLFLSSFVVLYFLAVSYGAPSITQLSDGTTIEYGALSGGLKQWQSSGILTQGCTLSTAINNCYGMSLTSNPSEQLDTHFPDSPRQRIEFRTVSQDAGTTFAFTWKHYLPTNVGTSSHFFHMMQVFDETADGPVVTLDAVNNQLAITDFARTDCGSTCPAVALDSYNGRTTLHTMQVTFGPDGKLDYEVTDAVTGDEIMEYHATGAMGGDTAYVKYGVYRATFDGMTAVTAAAGDFTGEQLS